MSIDTACSSSLVGTHFARTAILMGGSSRGISAGINLPMNWETTAMFAAAGMMAPDGRCKALDAAADGYVRSEAAVVLLLHSAAFWQGDSTAAPAVAFLAGTAVNQDGRSSSLTAPHGPSQQMVVLAAMATAIVTPSQLTAVEMHGTGGWVRSHHGSVLIAEPMH